MSDADRPASTELLLSCRPGKTGDVLTFAYTLENRGARDIYAMHAMPGIDAGGAPSANDQSAVIILDAPGGNLIAGKFAAPLPLEKKIAVPALPLARRLAPGARLEASLEIAMPLAEISPYFHDLPLRQYQSVDFIAMVFTIGYWLAGVDGLVAAPADYAPDLFIVVTRNTLRSARRTSQRFPTKGLQVFMRGDAFPRLLPP